MVVSDGKTKIQGLIELPAASLGDLVLSAEAKDGVLKIDKLAATGKDLELVGDGRVGLHDGWPSSVADLFIRFKFTDAYRGKNDLTKTLLGAPGSTTPALIDTQVAKMKKAKRSDGFYGFHAHGPLKRIQFDPSAEGSSAKGASAAGAGPSVRTKSESPFGTHRPIGAGMSPTPDTPPIPPIPPSPANAEAPTRTPVAAEPVPAGRPAAEPEPQPEPSPQPERERDSPREGSQGDAPAPEAPAE
jgi:hypothetical protein